MNAYRIFLCQTEESVVVTIDEACRCCHSRPTTEVESPDPTMVHVTALRARNHARTHTGTHNNKNASRLVTAGRHSQCRKRRPTQTVGGTPLPPPPLFLAAPSYAHFPTRLYSIKGAAGNYLAACVIGVARMYTLTCPPTLNAYALWEQTQISNEYAYQNQPRAVIILKRDVTLRYGLLTPGEIHLILIHLVVSHHINNTLLKYVYQILANFGGKK